MTAQNWATGKSKRVHDRQGLPCGPGEVGLGQVEPRVPEDPSKYWALVGVARYDGPPLSA
jgi:hypothetical protein